MDWCLVSWCTDELRPGSRWYCHRHYQLYIEAGEPIAQMCVAPHCGQRPDPVLPAGFCRQHLRTRLRIDPRVLEQDSRILNSVARGGGGVDRLRVA